MARQRRKFSAEFKMEAVRLLESSDKAASQLERELDISDGCLLRWKRELQASGNQAFPGQGRAASDQDEVQRLRHELEVACQERDILKKALAIFAHPSR